MKPKIAVYQVCPMAQSIARDSGEVVRPPMFERNATILALDDDCTRVLIQILEKTSGEFELAEKLHAMLGQRRVKLNQVSATTVK